MVRTREGTRRAGSGSEASTGFNILIQKALFKSAFGMTDRVKFYKQFSVLLGNNIPIEQALAELYVTVTRRAERIDLDRFEQQLQDILRERPSQPTGSMLLHVLRTLRRGKSFADGLADWVSPDESSVVRSGEESGKLAHAIEKVLFLMKKRGQFVKALWSALATPVLIFVGVFGAYLFNGFTLVPQFLSLMPLEKWQGDSRSFIETGMFVRKYAVFMGVGPFALIGLVARSMPRMTSPLRIRLDRFPPYSIYRMFQGSSFLLNLSTLLSSGRDVEQALETILRDATPYVRQRILAALRGLGGGNNIGDALYKAGYGFPDHDSIGFLRSLSSRAGFAKALDGSIEGWLDQSIDQVIQMAGILRMIGFAIGGYVITNMASAIYGLSQAGKGF